MTTVSQINSITRITRIVMIVLQLKMICDSRDDTSDGVADTDFNSCWLFAGVFTVYFSLSVFICFLALGGVLALLCLVKVPPHLVGLIYPTRRE